MKNKLLISLLSLCAITGYSDYVMMCAYFSSPVARIYKVKDDGTITHDYDVEVGGNPWSITFAPNGKWGLLGSHTTFAAKTQKTIIFQVNKRKITYLDFLHNELDRLISISPDSKYGVYGADLKTVRMDGNTSYTIIPTDNPIIGNKESNFSNYNGYLYVVAAQVLKEFKIAPDETMQPTGFKLDISPSSAYQDIRCTPDGKTLVTLDTGGSMQITVIRLKKKGGGEIVQQFHTESPNGEEIVFTPDSKFLIASFSTSEGPALRCYKINEDSKLAETGVAWLPHVPGEDLAITPDGKYVITRALVNNFSYFYVVQVNADGSLSYLPDKDFTDVGHVSAMAFLPEPQPTGWVLH